MIIKKVDAIKSLNKDSQFVIRGGELEWLSPNIPQPTEAEIQAEITRLQAEYEANEYQRQRALAYPSIADQLDQIYHEGIDAWKETISAVKAKYPKGA